MMAALPPASPPPERPKVIYVMGAGRSGSTILGVALGNCANIFHAGELETWLRRSGIPNFGGAERMEFWDRVRERVQGDDLFGDKAWRYLEHSLAPFRISGWISRRRLRQRYRQIATDLYDAIASAAEATYIIDTSHYPLRARQMRQLESIDLYLVYLVRDPQNVVASFDRRDVDQPPKSPLATNAYLWLTHLLSVFVFLRHRRDRRLFLRYEDFVSDPKDILRRILDCVDASTEPPELQSLKTGIPFQGNRLLRSDVLSLKNDTGRPRRKFLITALLQLPWASVFSRLRPAVTSSPER